MKTDFYGELVSRFTDLIREEGFWEEEIMIRGKTLTDEEAIGNPDRKDFPLLTGKESLMEADFRGARGQAFTDQPGPFSGTLGSIIGKAGDSNHSRAVFVSAINAVMAYLRRGGNTIHCRDNEPESCACDLAERIKREHGHPRIALIGYQPSMLEKLGGEFEVRVLDLDGDKIGKIHYGVRVEHGIDDRQDAMDWCDILLCTGSTVANGTLPDYLTEKPVYFFGTTIAGTAELLGLNRLCPRATPGMGGA